jgi:hypothetical protein
MSPANQLAQNILDLAHAIGVVFWLIIAAAILFVLWAMFVGGVVIPLADWLQQPHVRRWLYRDKE